MPAPTAAMRAPDLMRRKNPRHDHRRVLAAEHLVDQREDRRHHRDPVQAVEHREHRQTDAVEAGVGQHHQRQATQAEDPEQQDARIVAVGQPARDGRADQAEHADRCQNARAGELRIPWSTQYAIRWVPISPLVEKPQTPKLSASSQKSIERTPRISPSIATRERVGGARRSRRFGCGAERGEADRGR